MAIPEETVTVEIPAPLKSSIVAPVPTDPPAVAIPTPIVIPVSCDPSPLNEVAVTTPEEFTEETVIFGVPVSPCDVVDIPAVVAYPAVIAVVAVPEKDCAVIIPV